MRNRDFGMAFGFGGVLGLLVSTGVFGSQVLKDMVLPAFGSWYVAALAIVVSFLPMWRDTPGAFGRVIARVVGMFGVAYLAVLVAIAVVYGIVWPLTQVGP